MPSQSSTQINDKRLFIDVSYLKDCISNGMVSINWCPGKEMLANCMTKSGCSSDALLELVSTGCLHGHYKAQAV